MFHAWTSAANASLTSNSTLSLQIVISLMSDVVYLFNWGYWLIFINNSRMPLAWLGVLFFFVLAQVCWQIKAPDDIQWE